jgi:hypothetical protein
MANWNGFQLNNLPVWSDTILTGSSPGGTWSVRIANANDFVYFLTATGEVTDGGELWAGASRTIGISAKILFADINPPGALLTRGQVNGGANATIDGTNTTPPTWAPYCTTLPPDDEAGVVVDDAMGGTNPSIQGSGVVAGDPPSEEDPTVVDDTFTDFDNLTWTELVAIAQIEGKDVTGQGSPITSVQPSETGGRCNTADPLNWGDTVPTAPCGGYFPLIYHSGPLRLNANAYGQGILLVQGDVELAGGFQFFGIIITQGTFSTGVGTNRVIGSVMASNAADVSEFLGGNSEIIYSRCAITRSVLNNAALSRARPMEIRSWVDLSSALN